MLINKVRLRQIMLSIFACAFLLGMHALVPSQATAVLSTSSPQTTAISSIDHHRSTLWQDLRINLEQADSQMLAQAGDTDSRQSYIAILTPESVVPNQPNTEARAVVGAVLSGDRLVIRANFRDLSSPFRDYVKDPVSPPNPNITSGFHLHRGSPSENGPFQYALTVNLDSTGQSGTAAGEIMLSAEQKQALSNGLIYFDIHTTRNRGGELRGVLIPA